MTGSAHEPGTQPLEVAIVGAFPMHPLVFTGGVETSTWHLVQGLRTIKDVSIHIVTAKSVLKAPVRYSVDGVHFHYMPSPARFNTATGYRRIRRVILAELDLISPDVVHAQNALVHGSIAIRSNYPTVVSVHGVAAAEARHLTRRIDRWRRLIQAGLQRRTIERSRHLIQPTTYPEAYFGQTGTQMWHNTENPISRDFFDVDRMPRRGVILYVGAIIRRKRLLDLLEAMSIQVRRGIPLQLRVVGPEIEPGYSREVRQAVSDLELGDRVEFLGALAQHDLLGEYARCEMLVLPSGQETSPMVIGEAMAAEIPVVATDVGGVADLLQSGPSGIVVPVGMIAELADAIGTLHESAELRAQLSRNGSEIAWNRFSSEEVARRVIRVYERVIADGTPMR